MSQAKPSAAFKAATWTALVIGILGYSIGLWNSGLQLNEKGFYFVVLCYGLFSAISVQKNVRDAQSGIQVSDIYRSVSFASVVLCGLLMSLGLYNATMPLVEKGFYFMAFILSLFAAVAVQKNVRDSIEADRPKSGGNF